MLISVALTNFRGIEKLQTEIGPVTAFLGPNSCGKTTVLQAIRFACEALQLALESNQTPKLYSEETDPSLVVANGLLIDFKRLLPFKNWQALFTNQTVGEGVSLSVVLDFENSDPVQQLDARLACARNDQLKLSVNVKAKDIAPDLAAPSKRSPATATLVQAFLKKHAPIAVFIPPFYGTVCDEEFRTPAIIDHLLGSGDQSHVVRNLIADLDGIQLDRLNNFLDDEVDAQITARTSGDDLRKVQHLSVRFRDYDGEIELSAAGAGLTNLAALYSALARWRKESRERRVIFLLDEPEAHLHPRLQAEVSERLSLIVVGDYEAQLIVATHSVDILNRMSTRGALLVRCDRRSDPSATILDSDSELFDDLATWADLTPYTAINFLASRRVLFCEGSNDVVILNRLAALRFRNAPSRERGFRRWSLIRLHGVSNAPIADLLARLVRSDVLKARAKTSGFCIEVVLDRDYSRQIGSSQSEQDGIKEITTVWSRHSIESLLVEPNVLIKWVRAYTKFCTHDELKEIVTTAVQEADKDTSLNENAIIHLAAKLVIAELKDKDGKVVGGDSKFVYAQKLARELVKSEPWIWQRGKDRGRFVLGRIREALPQNIRNQFPTDLVRLIERVNINRIGDPFAAIPEEIGTLLDRLAQP